MYYPRGFSQVAEPDPAVEQYYFLVSEKVEMEWFAKTNTHRKKSGGRFRVSSDLRQ